MKHRYSFLFLPFQFLTDWLLLNVAFLMAYQFKFGSSLSLEDSYYTSFAAIANVVWLALVLTWQPYNYSRISFHVFTLVGNFLKLLATYTALMSFGWMLLKEWNLSRAQMFFTILIFGFLGASWRVGAVIVLKFYRAAGHNTRRYVVVGYGKLAVTIKRFYENHPEMGFQFCGFFDQINSENRIFLRGDLERLDALVATGKIDCVYCCAPYIPSSVLGTLVEKATEKNFQLKLVIDFAGFLGRRSSIEYHDMMPIVNISNYMWEDVKVKWLKRGFDVVFSLFVLVLGFPIWFIIGLITKFSSKGPVFYSQERTGRGGARFKIYKFRSMYVGSDLGHSQGNIDSRITRWGQFIRKTRLDEIPQFFNVLKGDMSVVGPRPLADYDVQTLVESAPEDFNMLLSLKPGITSIGQIFIGYARSKEEMRKRLKYDLLYLKKVSFFFDTWLIMQTVLVMVKGKGK
jgi:exopolysaccharide biosynthesis polyprenyl glycosylphosphotransferase